MHKILGDAYVVWDKGCVARFKRPAKTTLFAEFHVSPARLDDLPLFAAADRAEAVADVRFSVVTLGPYEQTW